MAFSPETLDRSDAESTRALIDLPKAHLHIHLEGSMRPSTLVELADHYGIPVPATRGYGTFSAFVGQYRAACEVLRQPEDLIRLVHEVVEDAALAGAVWIEPQYLPTTHLARLGAEDYTTDLVLRAGADAAERFGVGFGLVMTADRTVDPINAERLATLAASRAGVVAFGLANDEDGYPPEPFARAFSIADEAGLISAPHAGELAGPASVVGALDTLGASRIAHGVRSIEDPELVRRLVDEGICLDVCPTSNLMLSVFDSLAEHPLPALLAAGVRCSINADDPLLFGPGLLAEYQLVRDEMGLTDQQLAFIATCSIEDSGAPADLVEAARERIAKWLT
jgi:adenosine deaminase